MATKEFTREDVIEMLRKRQGNRTLSALAADLGVSLSYLSDIMRGNRTIGPSVLETLGLVAETETIYRSA